MIAGEILQTAEIQLQIVLKDAPDHANEEFGGRFRGRSGWRNHGKPNGEQQDGSRHQNRCRHSPRVLLGGVIHDERSAT